MLPWIIGGVIGATITAVVLYNEEENEKALIAQDDAEAEKKLKETSHSLQGETRYS
jgi:hypothetical protein